ncbi:Proton-dependent oligopeptide transporter family [Macleaya cordata]|uniref:Proton-dependent oligopeptide transporter family n=1 Tax=Macleaya cordata TaxID=56857 RepID=A0A200Q6L7_MACCD|nr:Proton-dependent oligopeptide transporter family [Macleaya cordata]
MTITAGAGVVDVNDDQYEPLLNNNSDGDYGEIINTRIDHEEEEEEDMVVDYRGERVIKGGSNNKLGGWRSASLIIVVDIAEAMAYYGIAANLINYLTGPLHQSTVTAAANVNTWVGFIWMLPVFGAFVADSYLGRFRTIVFSTLIYVLGLGLLTLSVVLPSLMSQPDCPNNSENNTSCNSPSSFQVIFFFSSLYLVAIGRAGFKPCVQAFGADQFDGRNPKESKSKSSFFNWWYFGLCLGSSFSRLILTYIQDNISWGLGFCIAFISLALALIVFVLGTKTYHYSMREDKENPLFKIARVFVAAARNWRISFSSTILQDEEIRMPNRIRVGVHQFKFLDKALIDTSNSPIGSSKHGMQCSIAQVEDAKVVLRLVPIWITCLIYAVVFSQFSTFFTKQGSTMDRSIGPGFEIPAASLQILINLSTFVLIPVYDCVFVPFSRVFTSKPNGITMLQRIGGGMFISTISMVVAAIIEKRRLLVARDFGLIDSPEAPVPMSVWWLAPQYLLIGLADVFTNIGLQEFFYDQVPDELRSIGVSIYLSILGIGSFLSGFLISAIEKVTGGGGHYSWFSNNLNRAHLDYFYWLLAVLSVVELAAFLYFSKSYLYKRGASM